MPEGIGGKVVFIIGAAGGIGSATARALGARGARLALADIDTDGLACVAGSLAEAGVRVTTHAVDVTAFEQIASAAADVAADFGRIDVLINAAGVMYIRPVIEANVTEWNATVDLNIKGVMWAVAAVLPIFLRQGSGHIISLGSVHGLVVSAGGATHSASKFAVNAFTEGLRGELGQYSIRVTTVNPGAVDTGIQNKSTGAAAAQLADIYAHGMSPETIARAIIFAIDQPDGVSLNHLVIRPTVQRL